MLAASAMGAMVCGTAMAGGTLTIANLSNITISQVTCTGTGQTPSVGVPIPAQGRMSMNYGGTPFFTVYKLLKLQTTGACDFIVNGYDIKAQVALSGQSGSGKDADFDNLGVPSIQIPAGSPLCVVGNPSSIAPTPNLSISLKNAPC
jgi:hypothetical protein